MIKTNILAPELENQNHNNVKLICLVVGWRSRRAESHLPSADHHTSGLFIGLLNEKVSLVVF